MAEQSRLSPALLPRNLADEDDKPRLTYPWPILQGVCLNQEYLKLCESLVRFRHF
jgi:hypothetical protein